MEDCISRKGLYEKTVALEKEAMEHCLKLVKKNGDPTDRMIWQAITAERAAFKHNVCDAPSAQQWTPIDKNSPDKGELPDNFVDVLISIDDDVFIAHRSGDHWYISGGGVEFSNNIDAWMPKPAPYQSEAKEAEK